jgi:hypothetical protein
VEIGKDFGGVGKEAIVSSNLLPHDDSVAQLDVEFVLALARVRGKTLQAFSKVRSVLRRDSAIVFL